MENNLLPGERLSLKELAKELQVHTSTVWRWVNNGVRGWKLPTFLVGARRFVSRDQAANFLQQLNGPRPPNTACAGSRSHQDRIEDKLNELGL
jgi:transposase